MLSGPQPRHQGDSMNSASQSRWNYTALITICILSFAGVTIVSVVILSLIPIYLQTKPVTILETNDTAAFFYLTYGTDMITSSSLADIDPNALANDFATQVHISQVTVHNASFTTLLTSHTIKKRQATGTQCLHNIKTAGEWFVLLISIKYPDQCRTRNCKKAFISKIENLIANIYYNLNLKITFTNQQTIDVQLTLCSYKQIGTAPSTSETTQTSTATETSTTTTTTTATSTTTTTETSTITTTPSATTTATTTTTTATSATTTTTTSTTIISAATTTTSTTATSITTTTETSTATTITSATTTATTTTTTATSITTTTETNTATTTTSTTIISVATTTTSTTATSITTTTETSTATTTTSTTTISAATTPTSTTATTITTTTTTSTATTTTSATTTATTTTTTATSATTTTTTSTTTISAATTTTSTTATSITTTTETSTTTTTTSTTTTSATTTSTTTTATTITTTTETSTTTTATTITTTTETSTTTTTTATTTTTTTITSTTTTLPAGTYLPLITQCQSTIFSEATSTNQIGTLQTKSQISKLKMLPAAETIGNRVLLKNTYLVEFPSGSTMKNRFKTITRSLNALHGIDQSRIKLRHLIQSSIFSGVSFAITGNHSLEALEMIEDAIAIHPVYLIPRPQPMAVSTSLNVAYDNSTDSINSHNWTGISEVHQKLQNFGQGVRVAVIDSGVYYLHPALGGCFGAGCKVGFGYDLVGDAYGTNNNYTATPDNDPLDDCSSESHGTHVSGIIAANTTGITQTEFIPTVPFIGVAPQVTIGAYRVFGCQGGTGTDIVIQAIGRAVDDNADIINLSLGERDAYSELSDAIAVQRAVSRGVYVVVSMGNSGEGGLQTGLSPGDSLGAMTVGSIETDTALALGYVSPAPGAPSSFTSLGPTSDLLLKPQISGIGGYVYSTVSTYYVSSNGLSVAYDFMSGTSMAAPYTAGTLALFLSSIGNPAPNTTSGVSSNGICRPPFSLAAKIFQSTAMPVPNYDSSLLSSVIQQGAGLVNAYQALTTTAIFSPSQLALNDTVRTATSYKVNLTNIGNDTATYSISHSGAALTTGVTLSDDQLLSSVIYSGDYAIVSINPTSCQIAAGESCQITLQFQAPTSANPVLLPIYSGFIYATNTANGRAVHLSYAGVVGNYYDAQIIVRNTASGIISGIMDENGDYATDQQILTMNATMGLPIVYALAWSTRYLVMEAVSPNDNSQPFTSSNTSYGMLFNSGLFFWLNLARHVANAGVQSFYQGSQVIWNGVVCTGVVCNGTQCTYVSKNNLPVGQYRIRFSALKHFGNQSNPNDFEVYRTPIFNLTF